MHRRDSARSTRTDRARIRRSLASTRSRLGDGCSLRSRAASDRLGRRQPALRNHGLVQFGQVGRQGRPLASGSSDHAFEVGSGRGSGGCRCGQVLCSLGRRRRHRGRGSSFVSALEIGCDGSSTFGRATWSEASASSSGAVDQIPARARSGVAGIGRPLSVARRIATRHVECCSTRPAGRRESGGCATDRVASRRPGSRGPHHRGDRAPVQDQAEMGRQRKHETIAERTPRRQHDQTRSAKPRVANPSTTQVVRSARNRSRNDSRSSPVIGFDLRAAPFADFVRLDDESSPIAGRSLQWPAIVWTADSS